MAASRTEFARCRGLAGAIAGVELRESPGISYGDSDESRCSKRARRRCVRVRDSACASTRATTAGLPALALGDLGLRNWIAGTRLRGRRYDHDSS